MIKVFTLNKNNKIELTKKELEDLLNQSFWEGYNKRNTYIYTSPSTTPFYYNYEITTADNKNCTITSTSSNSTLTFKQDDDDRK